MAIGWVSLTISAGIGILGGILSGVLSSIAGRIRINRSIRKKVNEINQQINDKVTEEFDARQRLLELGNRECFKCSLIIPGEATFCPFCGVPVSGSKSCDICKVHLPDNSVACYICGKGLKEPDPVEESTDDLPEQDN
jgi:hypothetical protein